MADIDQGSGERYLSEEEATRSDEAILRQVQDEQAELYPTAKGLGVILEPCEDALKVRSFFSDLAAYAGKVTQSIKPDGALTSRFVMVGPSTINGCPFVILSCFNRGFEILEFVLVFTKAQALAVQYGLRIAKVDETPDVQFAGAVGSEAEIARAGEEGGVEVSRSGRKVVGRITLPDGKKSKITAVVNDQFNNLSAAAVISVMIIGLTSCMQGKDLGKTVRASLDVNLRLLELMAERANRIGVNQAEVISVETVASGDLERLMYGKKSFAVWSVPEA